MALLLSRIDQTSDGFLRDKIQRGVVIPLYRWFSAVLGSTVSVHFIIRLAKNLVSFLYCIQLGVTSYLCHLNLCIPYDAETSCVSCACIFIQQIELNSIK